MFSTTGKGGPWGCVSCDILHTFTLPDLNAQEFLMYTHTFIPQNCIVGFQDCIVGFCLNNTFCGVVFVFSECQ